MQIIKPIYISWMKRELEVNEFGENTGVILSEVEGENLVTNDGRDLLFKCLFMLAASAGVVSIGVGASATAAVVTDSRLTHELIYNPTRKPLTNTSGAALTSADIVSDPVTISTVNYYKKVVCQGEWLSGDLNNGNQFAEYGLFTTATLPGTPTGTSGIMFNHYIDPAPTIKTALNAIQLQITIRM